jgi:hypothetical protein
VYGEIVLGTVTGRGNQKTNIGCLGSGSFYLNGYGSGSVSSTAEGALVVVSDRRAKNSIEPLPRAGNLDALRRLKPVSYALNCDPFKPKYVGFIAQDLEEVIPNCVDGKKYPYHYETTPDHAPKRDAAGEVIYKRDPAGELIPRYRSVDFQEIWTRGILGIQEQADQIDSLMARLAAAESVIEELRTRVMGTPP